MPPFPLLSPVANIKRRECRYKKYIEVHITTRRAWLDPSIYLVPLGTAHDALRHDGEIWATTTDNVGVDDDDVNVDVDG